MAVLRGAVEADVPIQFADREWTEFVFRSLYGTYAKGFADVASSVNETDADSGDVTFETEGDRLVKVSVELEYTRAPSSDPGAEVALAQAAPRSRPREVPRLPPEALRAGELPHGLRHPSRRAWEKESRDGPPQSATHRALMPRFYVRSLRRRRTGAPSGVTGYPAGGAN